MCPPVCRPRISGSTGIGDFFKVQDRVLEAAEIIPVESLGTTGDCGLPRSRTIRRLPGRQRIVKVRSRVEGTRLGLASQILGA